MGSKVCIDCGSANLHAASLTNLRLTENWFDGDVLCGVCAELRALRMGL